MACAISFGAAQTFFIRTQGRTQTKHLYALRVDLLIAMNRTYFLSANDRGNVCADA